ncbi:hypothetical protein NLN93_20460 [Citrobacter portucalensis]|nr:hypothetical protein [Citrobacter portucalensis]MCX8985141.1 hypothetical protein [Citrobacter portucalensis]
MPAPTPAAVSPLVAVLTLKRSATDSVADTLSPTASALLSLNWPIAAPNIARSPIRGVGMLAIAVTAAIPARASALLFSTSDFRFLKFLFACSMPAVFASIRCSAAMMLCVLFSARLAA